MPLSDEQQAIVNAPLVPMAVIACAGSGKTTTAIHRLVAMRRLLGESRGRIALLSFSNVAVDTFRRGYRELGQELPRGSSRARVDIDTLDGFIASNILRPHAHRVMGARCSAFLVTGGEPFLSGFTYPSRPVPLQVADVHVAIDDDGNPFFYQDFRGNLTLLDQHRALQLVTRLGRVGAYTHNLGRYWAYRTLREQPVILRSLACRYPSLVIDESQDIGSLHQAILELLCAAGVELSLIGDPNQGIYDFAGADGEFLRNYRERQDVTSFELTRNYRSIPNILTAANRISGRNDEADHAEQDGGAFFIQYSQANLPQLMDAFRAELATRAIDPERAAVLCRAASSADALSGVQEPAGQGVVKAFVEAALLRDCHSDFLGAFKAVTRGVFSLLESPPPGLVGQVSHPGHDQQHRDLRRKLWRFTRDPDHGLPSSDLAAASAWHQALLQRVQVLLRQLELDHGLRAAENLGRRVTRAGLPDSPLSVGRDLAAEQGRRIRVSTVHQAKGESIDAVLYLGSRIHIRAMLDGVGTELGRIGYVAVTRARRLLWVGVPANALRELRPDLEAAGFREAGA